MLPSLLGSAELCALAHDLVDVVQQYQQIENTNTTLQMHNTRMKEWDEICVMAINNATGEKRVVVKISLAQLTPAERSQLQLQIGLHNKTLTNPEEVSHQHHPILIH